MENKIKQSWQKELLAWFDVFRRDLPWRENKDPYRIWVSEVMLQQTRVETVKPYFENWMNLFPTLESLALADQTEVLRAWQGLGYYSRAKNLQIGVQEVIANYGGKIPQNRKSMETLKGVGSYTAGAILSIAYNLPEAAVDGNVLRVYARLYGIEDDVLANKTKKQITLLVEETISKERPGDFNEALMDFGSSLCTAKNPKCEECPLRTFCCAYEKRVVDKIPLRLKKTKVQTVYVTVGMIQSNGFYLLHKRPNGGLLGDMWEFPSWEGSGYDIGKLKQHLVSLIGPFETDELPCKQLVHIFSHRRWQMQAWLGEVKEMKSLPGDWKWVKREDFSTLPWAGPHGKLTLCCS